MKNASNNSIRMAKRNQISKNIFRATMLLAIFIFVFAFLCIVADTNIVSQIQNGTLNNIAEAGEWGKLGNKWGTWDHDDNAVNESSSIESCIIWDRVNMARAWAAGAKPFCEGYCSFDIKDDLKFFTNKGVVKMKLFYTVTNDVAGYDQTITAQFTNSSGNEILNFVNVANQNIYYESNYANIASNSASVIYFYAKFYGWSSAWGGIGGDIFEAKNIGVEFKGIDYTITINRNGGNGGTGSKTVTGGSTVGNITPCTRTGYYLDGYYTSETGGDKLFNADGTPCALNNYTNSSKKWYKNSNVTVYAHWTPYKCTFKYNPNNGGGAQFSETVTFDVPYTVANPFNHSFSKEYCFVRGWNTKSNGTGTWVPLGTQKDSNNTILTLVDLRNSSDDGKTIELYCIYQEIGFTFNGYNYPTFDPTDASTQLRISEAYAQISSYNYLVEYGIANIQPTSQTFTASIQFSTSSQGPWDSNKPTEISTDPYYANISISAGGIDRGSRIIHFIITDSDFGIGHIPSGADNDKWGTENNPYLIQSLGHLNTLALIVNGGTPIDSVNKPNVVATDNHFANCYFSVTNDIGTQQDPFSYVIGNSAEHYFAGNIKGNRTDTTNLVTITLNITGSANYCGLFGYVKGSYGVAPSYTPTYASIKYIRTVGSVNASNYQNVGGIVGYCETTKVYNCINTANVNGLSKVGGIIGEGAQTEVATNNNKAYVLIGGVLTNGANGTQLGSITGSSYLGGIVGLMSNPVDSNAVLTNYGAISGNADSVGGIFGFKGSGDCSGLSLLNYGTVTGTTSVGGIIGRAQCLITGVLSSNDIVNTTVTSTIMNSGDVISNGGKKQAYPTNTYGETDFDATCVGGIVGYTTGNISNCVNNGDISSTSNNISGVGGIVGTYFSKTTTYYINITYCVNFGDIELTAGGDYVGGIVGKLIGNGTNGKIENSINKGIVKAANNVGGIAGYLDNVSVTNCYNEGTNKYVEGSGDNLGGFFGKTKNITVKSTLTNSLPVNGNANTSATPTGSKYVGGIVGYLDSGCDFGGSNPYQLTNSGQIKGCEYIGGIFGNIPSSYNGFKFKATNSGNIIGCGKYVGGIVGRNEGSIGNGALYNTGNVYGFSSATHSTRTAYYVGGIIGYNTGDISNINISCGNSNPDVSGIITGASYVGGLIGATYNSQIKISTDVIINTTVYGGSSTATSNAGYCGGIFGYVAGTGANIDDNGNLNSNTSNYLRLTTTSYTGKFIFDGYGNYVGGIIGYATGIAIENQSASNTYWKYLDNNINSIGGSAICVGGIIGYLASSAIHKEKIGTVFSNLPATYDYAPKHVVSSLNTVVVPGEVYYYTYSSTTVYMSPTIYGKIISLPSNGNDYFIVSEINPFLTETANVNLAANSNVYNNYLGTGLYGRYANEVDISGKSFVGGLIGKIDAGVGDLASGDRPTVSNAASGSIFNIGNNHLLYLENEGSIAGSHYYIGGVIGALLNNTTDTTVAYKASLFAHMSNTGDFVGVNLVTAIDEYTNTSFVGGLIGSVGTIADTDSNKSNVMIAVTGDLNRNVENGSFNGDTSSEKSIRGHYYLGGVAGYINYNAANYIHNFINLEKIDGGSVGVYVGGIVGYMGSGADSNSDNSINNCISTSYLACSGTIDSTTNNFIGSLYVGGIVGSAGSITINNCYTSSYSYLLVDSVNGGICGNASASTIISNCWAIIYFVPSITGLPYTYKYKNTNGNYILVQGEYDWNIPNLEEMLYSVGLINSISSRTSSSSHSHNPVDDGKRFITLKLAIPKGTISNENDKYIAFFNGDGRRNSSLNKFTNNTNPLNNYSGFLDDDDNTYLYVETYVNNSYSYMVCQEKASFVNVQKTKASEFNALSSEEQINVWVLGFNNGRFSDEYLANFSSTPIRNGNDVSGSFDITCDIRYKNTQTALANDNWNVGVIVKNYILGHEETPHTISTVTEYKAFVSEVLNGEHYAGVWIKLLNDLNLGTYNASSNKIFWGIPGNETVYFAGNFDGNGKTLTYSYNSTEVKKGIGLFPVIATNVEIKNLYVKANIKADNGTTSAGTSVGGIVGRLTAGSLVMTNCKSLKYAITTGNNPTYSSISGYGDVGGLVGCSYGTIVMVNCVNTNDVISKIQCEQKETTDYGVGGMIGCMESGTASIDSSTNKGSIDGFQNVGGLVGLIKSDLDITNSCNTGYVHAGPYQVSTWSYAGGICGQIYRTGHADIYATYNSGNVTGENGRVGGIIACDTDNQENVNASKRTSIYYCFNSGNIVSGNASAAGDISGENWFTTNIYDLFSGGEVGGLVGMGCNLDLYYCYNVGDITCYGYVYQLSEHHIRAGGLIGQMWNYKDTTYGNMEYCYNAGFIKIMNNTYEPLYASGLVGSYIYQEGNVIGEWGTSAFFNFKAGVGRNTGGIIANNYSMKGQVDLSSCSATYDNKNILSVLGIRVLDHHVGNYQTYRMVDSMYYNQYWTVEGDVLLPNDMISGYDGTGSGTKPNGMTNFGNSNITTLNGRWSDKVFGYIYIPGCLPQLAIFAVDTEIGIAMTGKTSGYDANTQSYITPNAGSEVSPYVIQNGVDLLGMSQLFATSSSYDGSGKYYAFADGYNNLDEFALTTLDMNTLGLSSKSGVSYPYTYTSYSIESEKNTYFWNDVYEPSGTVHTHSNNKIYYHTGHGKSVAIYRKEISSSANDFKSANGNNTYAGQNFFQIGCYDSNHQPFRGTLSGYSSTDSNGKAVVYPEITNLRIKRTIANSSNYTYTGLIGYGDGCTIQNFAIGKGSSTASIATNITVNTSTTYVAAGAFLGKAVNECVLAGLEVHGGAKVSITTTNSKIYAGGIVGMASPNLVSSGRTNITIEICSFDGTVDVTSTGTTNYVGGIVGYTEGISNDQNVGVIIKECNAVSGLVSNASRSSSGIGTGGIVGYRNPIGSLQIIDCNTGNGTSDYVIAGNHTVGGIISCANGDDGYLTTISGCTVGERTIIRRVANGYNHTSYKTAFGGFAGYTQNCSFIKGNTFSGQIKLADTNNNYDAGENIGGLIGYIGSNTEVKNNIRVNGTIDAGSTQSTSIGGAIGYAPNATHDIDGEYYINPTMITTVSNNVGGFIGKNDGTIYLLGTASIVDNPNSANGTSTALSESQSADDFATPQAGENIHAISAKNNVGGFIGYNNGTIKIGTQTASNINVKTVGTFTATLVANVNGEENVGGFVGFNNATITTKDCEVSITNSGNICNDNNYLNSRCLGGIVGCNAVGAYFLIEEQDNYFANSGIIGIESDSNRITWAGGVVGYNAGNFTNIGTMANTGKIYGYEYVAGSIGYFNSGSLFGTMINGLAKTDGNDIVSRTTMENNAYVTRFSASTNGNAYFNATEIGLSCQISKGLNYTYNIGKTSYYFTAPITGMIVGFDYDVISVEGSQLFSGTLTGITNTTQTIIVNSTNSDYPTLVNYNTAQGANNYYKYSTDLATYYYTSTSGGAGFVDRVDGHTMTFYPTLFATYTEDNEILGIHNKALPSDDVLTASEDEDNKKLYKFDGNYVFDGTYLTGKIKYNKDGALAFSELKITATKTPVVGAISLDSVVGLRIKSGLSYKFYIGTVPYFFTSMVTAKITSIDGKVITLGSYTEESIESTTSGKDIIKGKQYIINKSGITYWFTADVDGTLSSNAGDITTSSVKLTTEIQTTTSAKNNLTVLNLGGKVVRDGFYKFKTDYTSNTYYYFKANYNGNITFLGQDGDNGVRYGITNSDYTDMVAATTSNSAGLVSGKTNIGGVISVVNYNTTVGIYKIDGEFVDGVNTQLINFGTVQSTTGENVGGSIGMMAGQVKGETIHAGTQNEATQYVEFFNYGTVKVVKNGGGCVGIFEGIGDLVKMFNYEDTEIQDRADVTYYENVGGCIGLVKKYVPGAGDEGTERFVKLTNAEIVNSGKVRATTTRSGRTGNNFGGVIGYIADGAVQDINWGSNPQNETSNWQVDLYSDGSVYCGKQETGGQNNVGQFSNVGGLIGHIGKSPIVLKSVLNYTKRSSSGTSNVTMVSGYNNVGGIVGYNASTYTQNHSGMAAVRYCYNVGGEVWGNFGSNTVGGIVGAYDTTTNPTTECCYWISGFKNSALQNADVGHLGSTLTQDWTTIISNEEKIAGEYTASSWKGYFAILKSAYGLGGLTVNDVEIKIDGQSPADYWANDDFYEVDDYTYVIETAIYDDEDEIIGYNYSYIDFYDIFFPNDDDNNPYGDYIDDAVSQFNDKFNWRFNYSTKTTDKNIATMRTIHDLSSTNNTERTKAEAEYADLKGVIETYLVCTLVENETTGDLGYFSADSSGRSYSTGSVYTGYFFAFSNDDNPTYIESSRNIQTEHTVVNAADDYDLSMWKYISQAYGNEEVTSHVSNIIYKNTNDADTDTLLVNRAGGSARTYHIYARAYMPEKIVNNQLTATGFYLYVQAQQEDGLIVSYNAADGAFYIDADSESCQNVLVFYKEFKATKKLTYNGLERVIPVAVLGFNTTETTDPQSTYFRLNTDLDTSSIVYNKGTDAGTYYTNASIFYIPNNAYIFNVADSGTSTKQIDISSLEEAQKTHLVPGNTYFFNIENHNWYITIPSGIIFPNGTSSSDPGYGWLASIDGNMTSTVKVVCPVLVGKAISDIENNTHTWQIVVRKLNVQTKKVTVPYNGQEQYVSITVTGILFDDATVGTYDALHSFANDDLKFKVTQDTKATQWECEVTRVGQVTSSKLSSAVDGGYCADTIKYDLVKYEYKFYGINAGAYKNNIQKQDTNNPAGKNYNITKTEGILEITRLTLTITCTDAINLDYDGLEHEITLVIKGWAAGDADSTLSSTATTINGKIQKNGLTNRTITTSGCATVSGVREFRIKYYASSKGTKTLGWNASNIGNNYKIGAGSVSFSILALTLVCNPASSNDWGTVTYDGEDHEYWVEIKPKKTTVTLNSTMIAAIKSKLSPVMKTGDATILSAYDSDSKVYVGMKAKNAGAYVFKIPLLTGTDENYNIESVFESATQTINKAPLTATGTKSGESNTYIYNQLCQGLTNVNITGFVKKEGLASSAHMSIIMKKDNVSITNPIPYGISSTNTSLSISPEAANKGSYLFEIQLTDTANDLYARNYSLTKYSYEWDITPLTIIYNWNETASYVYTGDTRTQTLSNISITDGEHTYGPYTLSQGFYNVQIGGSGKTDKLIISYAAIGTAIHVRTDDQTYKSQATYSGVDSTSQNAAGPSSGDNYIGNAENSNIQSPGFVIVPSEVNVSVTAKQPTNKITKTYDNTVNISENSAALGNRVNVVVESTNGGANQITVSNYAAQYNNKNAGDRNINYTLTITQSTDYIINNHVEGNDFVVNSTIANYGYINKKTLEIVLNTKGGHVSKVFDNTDYFGGINAAKNGASNTSGSTSATSKVYTSGNGFRVNGIIASESSNSIVVSAKFVENRDGKDLGKYVNNVVYDETDGYSFSNTDLYTKKLVFTITSGGTNYSLSIQNMDISPSGNTITYEDGSSKTMHIYITKYALNINYSNTYQSYAKTRNVYTYESDGWDAITGVIPSRNTKIAKGLEVIVNNDWMYTDAELELEEENRPEHGHAAITSKKTIVGRVNSSSKLYAKYKQTNTGIELNYTIKNQPTLVIDYFVPTDNSSIEIGTLAGLMIATNYYKNYSSTERVWIDENDDDFAQYILDHPTAQIVTVDGHRGVWAEFSLNPPTYDYNWLAENTDAYNTYIANHPDAQIVYNDEEEEYGVWENTGTSNPISASNFRLVADISGIMTESDYKILKNAFKNELGNPIWGVENNTYLTNFMQTNIGEEVVVVGNYLFADLFTGSFDANGYVIKNFTHIYNVKVTSQSTINIGFFGKVANSQSSIANITDLALRNYKLYVYDYTNFANTLNIGALIGLSEMTTSLTNTTIHATVNVDVYSSDKIVNAGILMGKYSGTISSPVAGSNNASTDYGVNLAIENTIVLGNMTVNNESGTAYVGGVVGTLVRNNIGGAIFGAVSFADINVTAGTTSVAGLIGYTDKTTNEESVPCTTYLDVYSSAAYLKNSTLARTSKSNAWTVVNNAIGNVANGTSNSTNRFYAGETYTNILTRTTSAYNNSRQYVPESISTEKNTLDVIAEVKQGGGAKYSHLDMDGTTTLDPREPTRLYDLIKTYIFKVEITASKYNNSTYNTIYTTAATNSILNGKMGTNSAGDKLTLAYAQHVTMLRIFRFASFELVKQINLPVNSYNIVYSGNFYGTIDRVTVQVIEKNATLSEQNKKILGGKEYTSLEKYIAAYALYYNVTLTQGSTYYEYTPSIYVYNLVDNNNTMFEHETTTVPIDWAHNE